MWRLAAKKKIPLSLSLSLSRPLLHICILFIIHREKKSKKSKKKEHTLLFFENTQHTFLSLRDIFIFESGVKKK